MKVNLHNFCKGPTNSERPVVVIENLFLWFNVRRTCCFAFFRQLKPNQTRNIDDIFTYGICVFILAPSTRN